MSKCCGEEGELIHMHNASRDMYEALAKLADHFADVMGGPMVAGRGIEFLSGVEGIPTLKAARDALAKAEGK
jgi:hypothetical protein